MPRRAGRPALRCGPPPPAAVALAALACLLACGCAAAAASAPAYESLSRYNPWRFNKVCRYSAAAVPAALFEGGVHGGLDFAFPLENERVVNKYEKPYEACFGPDEKYSVNAIASGWKLPCSYSINADGSYQYQEEHACEVLVKSNCYCYALDRFVGSYCEPGLGGTGKDFELPVDDCAKAAAGVEADGGKPVDRETVYGPRPNQGHFIALAIKPADMADDTGDFHFWRLDSNEIWSYKAGDTLVRNTLRDGTPIKDIEKNTQARGDYTLFCGYFHVIPSQHKLAGNKFWYSDLPSRLEQWRSNGVKPEVQPLAKLPPDWLLAYSEYFADSGWEDNPPGDAVPKERAFVPSRRPGSGRKAGPQGAAAGAAADAAPVRLPLPSGLLADAVAAAQAAARAVPHWYSVRPPGARR